MMIYNPDIFQDKIFFSSYVSDHPLELNCFASENATTHQSGPSTSEEVGQTIPKSSCKSIVSIGFDITSQIMKVEEVQAQPKAGERRKTKRVHKLKNLVF